MSHLVQLFVVSFVLSLAICHVTAAKGSNKFKCNAEEKNEIDTIVARIMTYGREDRKFPVSAVELKKYCKEQNNLVAKLEDYKNQCLKSRAKQIVSIVIYSIKSLVSMYCKNPNSKRSKDLLFSAGCANQATHGYLKCNDNYVELLLAVEDSKDSKQQLGQMCCGYIEIFKCIKEQASHHKICTEEKVEANSNYIKGFFDNAINVICGDYNDSSDKCDKFSLVRKVPKSKARPNSYFSPLVKVLADL